MVSTFHKLAIGIAVLLGTDVAAVKGPAGDELLPKEPDSSLNNRLPRKVRSILNSADKVELFAISPRKGDADGAKPKDCIQGWKILGTATVSKKDEKQALVEAIDKAIAESGVLDAGRCFRPRHALRASHDGKVVELVICFECTQIHVYLDGEFEKFCATKRTPEKEMNRILNDAKTRNMR